MTAHAPPPAAHAISIGWRAVRMPSRRRLKQVAGLLVLGACMATLGWLIDLADIADRLRSTKPAALGGALAAVLLATAITYWRMRAALALFGFAPAHAASARAFLIGQVSNQFLANVLGQGVSRAAVLQRSGVPFSVALIATFIERAVAAASLLALSVAAVAFYFGRTVLDLERGGAYLLGLALGVTIALTVTGSVVYARHGGELTRLWTARRVWQSLRVLALTLAAHAAMLAAYLIVLAGLGADAWRADVAGALLVVMFTASLPISFGGWGLRELSAAHALSLVGMPAATAVAGSALVGVVALAATLLPTALLALLRNGPPALTKGATAGSATHATAKLAPCDAGATQAWDRVLLWGMSLLAGCLIYFQVRVPLAGGEININAADAPATLALAIAVAAALLKRDGTGAPSWLWRSLGLLGALFLSSLLIGYANHGWSDWAFLNRGLGWLVLAGYALAGAAAANVRGAAGRGTVLLAFAATGVALCLAQMLLLQVDRFVVTVPRDMLTYPLEGFAQNRNAFAFQILLLLAALAVLLRAGVIGARSYAAACGVALIVVWETLSRTGWIAAAMLIFVLALTVDRIDRARFLLRTAAGTAAMLALYLSCSYALATASGTDLGGAMLNTVQRHEGLMLRPEADNERWHTLVSGLRLWIAHPLFGTGLGGYVAARAAAGQSFQVIHSVPVWLLAELGLLGAAVVLAIATDWVVRARRALAVASAQPWAMGLLASMIVMAVGGLAHDFLYQRSFWFLAGLFAAGMSTTGNAARSPSSAHTPR